MTRYVEACFVFRLLNARYKHDRLEIRVFCTPKPDRLSPAFFEVSHCWGGWHFEIFPTDTQGIYAGTSQGVAQVKARQAFEQAVALGWVLQTEQSRIPEWADWLRESLPTEEEEPPPRNFHSRARYIEID